ncbi:MAG: lysophospholipid acyltransferase family protein [Pseudomonadales bacterium]
MSTTTQTLSESQAPRYGGPHRWQVQGWARLARRVMRNRAYTRWVDQYCTGLNVTGIEHLRALDGPCILAPNHSSHMDTLVLHAALPEIVKGNLYYGAAADRWFVKGRRKLVLQPWYQSLVLGNFPIHRGGGSKTLDYARWLLDQRCNLCIFPEGTRATSDRLGDFRVGVALLALEKQVPVVPVYLSGLREMRPKGQLEVRPGVAGVEFLEPLRFAPGTSPAAATAQMWERMNAVHLSHHPERQLPRAA